MLFADVTKGIFKARGAAADGLGLWLQPRIVLDKLREVGRLFHTVSKSRRRLIGNRKRFLAYPISNLVNESEPLVSAHVHRSD